VVIGDPRVVDPVTIGDGRFAVLAGPCAIESEAQFRATAGGVVAAGAVMVRGGIFKLRTRPESFQGLGEEALEVVRAVRAETRAPVVSEVIDPRHIERLAGAVDMFQVGTRNMFNYPLLAELGRAGKPVLLKRAFSARIEEWVTAADYVRNEGNDAVVLCERGIRTFETRLRNTLDLGAVAWLKETQALPVVVDPSHASGDRRLVAPLAAAAAAVGADGLLVEVHRDPERALSDGPQSLDLAGFEALVGAVSRVLAGVGRQLTARG